LGVLSDSEAREVAAVAEVVPPEKPAEAEKVLVDVVD
jgi:hypothetical protein